MAESALEECYRLMYRGMVEKDQAILEAVLAPDVVLVRMTGMHQLKEAFIRSVTGAALNYA